MIGCDILEDGSIRGYDQYAFDGRGLPQEMGGGRDVLCGAQPGPQRHQSAERPKVRVWGKEADGILTLSCHAHGFYPRPIAISWMKDGMVRDQETRWGGIVPNRDGTYHASAAIDVLPEDRDNYRCRVEHATWGMWGWDLGAVWKRKSGKSRELGGESGNCRWGLNPLGNAHGLT
uniref:Ig-like domain-containing protein n=1 Tax=Gallus gallus TaxID=9031 RepID=A0A8V0XBZ9_CHICK